jgi:cyclopropane fatty-acyl-phospholipid synthase-like methyltransferase
MVYSCAYFARPEDALEAAQERKLDLICRKLRLDEGDRLLDIGCGWGSLVIGAMQSAGLEARDVESLREHYPLTLRRWVSNLAAHREDAIREAGPQRERVWRLYVLGSALSLEAGEISVHQVLAARPGASHGLPLTRTGLLA